MKDATGWSLRCRHCQAENAVGSSRCWLCDAADWVPDSASSSKAVAPGGSGIAGRWVTMTVALIGLTILVGIGLGQLSLETANIVVLAWWVPLGVGAFRRLEGQGVMNPVLKTIAGMAIALIALIFSLFSVFALLFLICSAAGPRNWH